MKHNTEHNTGADIAQTILSQLGGERFVVMTGAKNLGHTENSLQGKIGRNSEGVTHFKITLNAMDLYDVTFYAIRGTKAPKVKGEALNVPAESLIDIFTRNTGLLLFF